MAKILFINPPSRKNIYLNTNVSVATPSYPSLTLATLAGNLIDKNEVKIIDLDLENNIYEALFNNIKIFNPDLVATTATTPHYPTVKKILYEIKNRFPHVKTVLGGVHATSLPEEVKKDNCADIVVLGEGDSAIPELLASSSLKNPIKDLNELPYPVWKLFDLQKYKNSRISSRKNPVGLIETSRGCSSQCNFCNKLTFGTLYRAKEPKRVVDEMEYMLKCGFQEIHIIDDSFTQEINRAKEVCIEISRRNLKFPWSLFNGVRVDMVDSEFFKLAKKSGCWQVAFGIETGDENILKRIHKRTTLSQTEKAVKFAKLAGINTFGFFILGLSGETVESMKRTIRFAKKLPLDIAKFDICIPYPGTPYYKELEAEGRIRSKDWEKYSCHQLEHVLYNHTNLSWPIIIKYYKIAFRAFYLRPSYFLRRFIRSLRNGDLLHDIRYFLKVKW